MNSQENDSNIYLELKPCVLCGSNSSRMLYSYPAGHYDHSRYETCSWDGRQMIPLSIVQCSQCGLIFSRPSFVLDALDLVYPDDIIDESHFDSALKSPKHNDMISLARKYFPEGKVLFDIGTRYGALPYHAREKGDQAYGLEFNTVSIELAKSRGIDYIFQGTMSDLSTVTQNIGLSSLDIVVMDDVLEHLYNPVMDLEIISANQKSGDGLIMRQMNWDSLGRRIFRNNWYYIQPAAHMYYFDGKRIEDLLKKADYKIVKFLYPNQIENMFLTLLLMIRMRLSKLLKPQIIQFGSSNKSLYLTKRRKSWNDLFTVVASKR